MKQSQNRKSGVKASDGIPFSACGIAAALAIACSPFAMANPPEKYVTLAAGSSYLVEFSDGQRTHIECASSPARENRLNERPTRSALFYLKLDDAGLVHLAISEGVGSCRVTTRSGSQECAFYIRANGAGYPSGTGCVNAFGDGSGSISNAATLLRAAINAYVCDLN